MKNILALTIAFFLFSGCASGVKTVKNKSFEADKYKRVAVVEFTGNNKDAANTLAEMLVPHLMELGFDVVERSNMDKLLREQKVGVGGALDHDTIHKIGKILGVDALVFGNFHYTKKEIKRSKVVSNRRAWRYYKPVRTTAYTTFTTETVIDGITIRMVDVETGMVLLSSTYPKEIGGEEVDNCFEEMTKSINETLKK